MPQQSQCKLDLEHIRSCLSPDVCYPNSSFGSLNMQDDFRTVCQLFKNGNIIVIGGQNENEARAIFEGYVSRLNHLGLNITFSGYMIRNIIATHKHHEHINLTQLAQNTGLFYEPEIFPAVRYRNKDLKITVNIFHTGSCVFLGARTFEALSCVAADLKKLLCSV